jgi:hypothetical protein
MKKILQLEISKTEAIIFTALICWILASIFIPLPDVSSLGS